MLILSEVKTIKINNCFISKKIVLFFEISFIPYNFAQTNFKITQNERFKYKQRKNNKLNAFYFE